MTHSPRPFVGNPRRMSPLRGSLYSRTRPPPTVPDLSECSRRNGPDLWLQSARACARARPWRRLRRCRVRIQVLRDDEPLTSAGRAGLLEAGAPGHHRERAAGEENLAPAPGRGELAAGRGPHPVDGEHRQLVLEPQAAARPALLEPYRALSEARAAVTRSAAPELARQLGHRYAAASPGRALQPWQPSAAAIGPHPARDNG